MQIFKASPELAESVKAIIVGRMAHALLSAPIDLEDDVAVITRLACNGFGSASIANLMEQARTAALDTREYQAGELLH